MPDEESEQVNQITGLLLDILLQQLALQFALVEHGAVTHQEVKEKLDWLDQFPEVLKLRVTFGLRSKVLDALLNGIQGTVQ